MNVTVQRKRTLTKKELADHVKSIGKALSLWADGMDINPEKVTEIVITAKIAPLGEVTTVHIETELIADPRTEKEQ